MVVHAGDDGALTFRQARWKLAILIVGGLAFCALGVFLMTVVRADTPNDPWPVTLIGLACTVFFALCTAAGVAGLFRPVTVTVGPEGLAVRTLIETYSRPWADLSKFGLGSIRGTQMVVFDDARPKRPRVAAMNVSIVGANSALPTALTISPKELLAVVLAAETRWGERAINAVSPSPTQLS